MTSADRIRGTRVSISWRSVFAPLALSVLTAACGPKPATTTPKDPAGAGSAADPATTAGTEPGGGTQGPGSGSGSAQPAGPGATPTPPEPVVVAPNLDPDPAQAKAAVDQQLQVARSALAAATPDPEAALRAARAALAIDAASVEAAAYVAFAYYHKKLYDTAELVLDDLFRREAAKQNAVVYYVYGLIYDKTNRPEKALAAYQRAVELDPRHASALVNLGTYQLRNSNYAAAQQTFERLTKEFNRTDAITLTSLGSAYRGRAAEYPPGSPDRDQYIRTAEAAYKRATEANASYGPAYYNLGLLYLDADPFPGVTDPVQRLTTAKNYFDQYKNMPGFDVKLYDSRTKDVDKALKRAQKAKKAKTT